MRFLHKEWPEDGCEIPQVIDTKGKSTMDCICWIEKFEFYKISWSNVKQYGSAFVW